MVDSGIATNRKRQLEQEWRSATSKLPAVLSRSDFPPGFVFGSATSAYQVEGAWNEGGKGPSIWDSFSHIPGTILDGSNGDIAVDQYHRYKEDVELMAKLGFDACRFSISWPRIFPDGTKLNEEGVAYYNNLINALLDKGIEPFVTLFHWDLPLYLQDSLGGWLNKKVVDYFALYAETCFASFGDRVKNWVTFNEPHSVAYKGYSNGVFPPGRHDQTSSELYLAAHHMLLSHAEAATIYRTRFQEKQGGQIGLVVNIIWGEPLTDEIEDRDPAARHIDFELGWFLDPVYFGDYPKSMRKRIGKKLPEFSEQEKQLLRQSVDFVGLNHYTSRFVVDQEQNVENQYDNAKGVELIAEWENGDMIGEKSASPWLYVVPWGMRKLLHYISQKYNNPRIYITENGRDDENDAKGPTQNMLDDKQRVKYYQGYLASVAQAIQEGVDVRGYMAWSFVDNFEWEYGYTKRYGLVYVDYKNGLTRYPKSSAYWFSRMLKGGEVKKGKGSEYSPPLPPSPKSSAYWLSRLLRGGDEKHPLLSTVIPNSLPYRLSCLVRGGEGKIGKQNFDPPPPSNVVISSLFLFLLFFIPLFIFLFF